MASLPAELAAVAGSWRTASERLEHGVGGATAPPACGPETLHGAWSRQGYAVPGRVPSAVGRPPGRRAHSLPLVAMNRNGGQERMTVPMIIPTT